MDEEETTFNGALDEGSLYAAEMQKYTAVTLAVLASVIVVTSSAEVKTQRIGIPGRFIVEFKASAVEKRDTTSNDTIIDEFISSLATADVEAEPLVNYTSSIFNGVSIKVSNDTLTSTIDSLLQVEKVYPVFEVPRPKLLDVVADKNAMPKYNPHIQTGVSKLHDEGNFGAGAIVAVIDTGVDWTHPALGGGYGPGFKIEGGYDFVGDWFDIEEDNDPYDEWDGHGTHVTGIIAGESERFNGVAPNARIRVYKVVGRFIGIIATDILISAHIKAYEDGADIISTSIGDSMGWADGAWAVTCNRIGAQGVVVLNAAGNSGLSGTQLLSGASVPENVVAVASTDSDQLPGIRALANGTNGAITEVPYLTLDTLAWSERWGPTKTGLKLYSPLAPEFYDPDFTYGCSERGFDDWDDTLEFRVVLVRRATTCDFVSQARSALARGSQFVFIINDERAPVVPDASPAQANMALVPRDVGLALEKRLINGEEIWVTFPDDSPADNWAQGFQTPRASYFTSWGLGNDASLKPDIAGPGGAILSTFPQAIQPYLIASGTSMATPYLAGVAALYISAHGGRAAIGVEGMIAFSRSLSSAGNPLFWDDGSRTDPTAIAPAHQVGGGQIDAYRLVHSPIKVFPNKIQVNHTGANALRTRFDITVKNSGPVPILFQVSHLPSPSVYTYDDGSDWGALFPPVLVKDKVAEIAFGDANFTVKAGDSRILRFQVKVPTGLDEVRLPVFSGYIVLTGSNGDTISVPYAGFATDGKKINPIAPLGFEFTHTSGAGPIVDGSVVALAGGDDVFSTVSLRYGTKLWRIELVDALKPLSQLQYPGTPGQDGLVGVIQEIQSLGRNDLGFNWGGILSDRFANGTLIPEGKYRYVARVLRPFWKPEDRGAWELYSSGTVEVRKP
ncbi:peptidase S8/S53 domain-containing protein [Leptodontidium sp. 2 PMI_412]|nr:peptidase S8/S53 domain-containing protein [Leptodontidium sp. 2 PMI_412]